jgi:TolB protein
MAIAGVLAGAHIASAADQRIAFQRGDAVYVSNVHASLIRKVAEGIFPAISPDAKALAFTRVEPRGNSYVRRLMVINILTSEAHLLSAIPGDNVYNGVWSADQQWVAFTFQSAGVWNLGTIKPDGTDLRIIKKGDQESAPLYSPCWARDGRSIFCQDMTNVYRVGLDGTTLSQWNINRIVPNGAMSGDSRIDVSPNGNRLLLSIEMDEEYDRKDWDGPVPALWAFDLTTQTAARLTSKSLFAWDGCWMDDTNVLFISQSAADKRPTIYRMDRKTFRPLIYDATRPSVSRP